MLLSCKERKIQRPGVANRDTVAIDDSPAGTPQTLEWRRIPRDIRHREVWDDPIAISRLLYRVQLVAIDPL